ncbi:WD40/YVTN/BNR-like repeat-containing protein [Duganella sp. PWIR1]
MNDMDISLISHPGNGEPARLRRRLCAALVLSPLLAQQARARGGAGVVGDVLDQAALPVQQPGRTVLLDAAYAGSALLAVGERGMIARSVNDGRSWQQIPAPTSTTLTAVSFQGDQRGLAVGHGGVVLATEDAGRTWHKRLDGRRIAQLVLQAAERSGAERAILQAKRMVSDGPDKPLLALQWISSRRVLAFGAYNIALYSEDGGRNWAALEQPLDNPLSLHIYAARARHNQVLLAGEQGLALLSEDGGKSFRRLSQPYRGSFFSAEIADDGQLWLAGLRGNVWHSADAGKVWQSAGTQSQATVTSSALVNSQLILGTVSGQVLRQRGNELAPLLRTALPPINAILPLRQGGLLALTVAGAITLPAAAIDLPGNSA